MIIHWNWGQIYVSPTLCRVHFWTRHFDGFCWSPSVAQTMDDPPATPEDDVGRADGLGPVKHWYWKCFLGKTRRMATICYNYGTRVLGVFGDDVFTTTSFYFQIPCFFCNCLARCLWLFLHGRTTRNGKRNKRKNAACKRRWTSSGIVAKYDSCHFACASYAKTYLRNNTRMGYGFKIVSSFISFYFPSTRIAQHDSW